MAASLIIYLYDDLPDGHTVLATEWNSAMGQIKETINQHAREINQGLGRRVYQIESEDWGLVNDLYKYVIQGTVHTGGVNPIITITDADSNVCHDLIESVDPNNADITLASPIPLSLKVIVL